MSENLFTILNPFVPFTLAGTGITPFNGARKLTPQMKRHNTKNLKQIFPKMELYGLSPNFHIYVSVSDLYIPTIGLPILLQENLCSDTGNI